MAKTSLNDYSSYNQVALIRGGHAYFELLETLVNEAREVIFLQTYIFDEDFTGKKVAASLSRASKRGVKVYVLLDGYASQHLSTGFLESWKLDGVFFRWFEPLLRSRHFYFGRRLHHKVLVVDGVHGLVGGVNISDKYNDLPGNVAWLDWAIHVQGESVNELQAICAGRALRGRFSMKGGTIAFLNQKQEITTICHVRVRVNDWVRGRREISTSYLEMLRNSKSEVIMMSSYFMPGSDFRKQIRMAAKRGVTIRLILAGISDVRLGKLAERYLYPWLMRNKIEIYEYQKSVLHGKISVCDRQWVTVGSYNLNELSAKASVELNLDVKEPQFGDEVHRQLESIIKNDCLRISRQTDKHDGPFNRLVQYFAFLICRLILFLFTFYFRQRRT